MPGSDQIDPLPTAMAAPHRSRWIRVWWLLPVALIALLLGVRQLVVASATESLRAASTTLDDPPGAHALQGSLYVARGGPYVIGFQSAGPARLVVGNESVVGAGVVKKRIVLQAGAVDLHFATTDNARLMWSPPGRRGDMEYLPASALAPDSSALAHFGTFAGAAIADGIFATAIALVIIAGVLFASRNRLRCVSRRQWLALAAVFALALVVRCFQLNAAGQTWDEDANWAAGRNYVTNLLSLDIRPASWQWNFEHPPMMKYIMGIGAQFADGYGPARFIAALLMSLSCVVLVPLVGRLFTWRVGVIAGVLASLTPTLIAHSKVVGHEAPTVFWWTLGLLLAVSAFDDINDADPVALRLLRRRMITLGIVLGLAVASRFVNVFLGPLMGTVLLLCAPKKILKLVAVHGALILPSVAFVTLIVVWPRLWYGPFSHLADSWQKLKKPHSTEPFLGTITNTPNPLYFVVYLFATMPLGIALSAAVGVVSRVQSWRKKFAADNLVQQRAGWITLCWLLVPLGVMASPVRQDGVRYVMPCILALTTVAAGGLDWIANELQPRIARARVIVPTVAAAYLAIVCIRIHPYYLDYFGEQVGGPRTVAARHWFETAWWGEGVDRAVDYVNDHAAPNARVYRDCIEPVHLAWFRGDLWIPMVTSADAADWIIAYSPSSHPCSIPAGFEQVFEVDAAGAPLARVFNRVQP
jgi:4-amino-4-deoxy-L-arabinose transferase-like glycosyltransferase